MATNIYSQRKRRIYQWDETGHFIIMCQTESEVNKDNEYRFRIH